MPWADCRWKNEARRTTLDALLVILMTFEVKLLVCAAWGGLETAAHRFYFHWAAVSCLLVELHGNQTAEKQTYVDQKLKHSWWPGLPVIWHSKQRYFRLNVTILISRDVVPTKKVLERTQKMAILNQLQIHIKAKREKGVETPFPHVPTPLPPCIYHTCQTQDGLVHF